MTFRRGDVLLVRYPDSNMRTYKKRPVLVVQSDVVPTALSQRILACITSNVTRGGPARVLVRQQSTAGQAMGLLTDSVVMADNLATILEREVDEVIGHCPVVHAVDAALLRILGLPSALMR